MGTVFRYRLSRLRGQILGWGLGLALYALMLTQFYGTVVEQKEQIEKMLSSYPQEMMAFFGGFDSFATPSGYLNVEFFSYIPLIVGIFALVVGSALLVGDEENGRLDLILAHPISRRSLFWGRVSAFAVATIAISALVWLGLFVSSRWTALHVVGPLEMAQPVISLLAVLFFLGALALLLSFVLPSRRSAAMATGFVMVGSFLLVGLARLESDLEPIAKLTPLYYYQGGEAMDNLKISWGIGLMVFALLFTLLAWWRFERRDIRVGGEGSWVRPSLSALRRRLLRRAPAARPGT